MAASPSITAADVDKALAQLLPAITGMGGKAEFIGVDGGTVQLKFSGPDRLRKGIELALKDDKRVTSVAFV